MEDTKTEFCDVYFAAWRCWQSQYKIIRCWLLFATKYQVDQVAIRLQPAGLGSDTPQQQLQLTRLP